MVSALVAFALIMSRHPSDGPGANGHSKPVLAGNTAHGYTEKPNQLVLGNHPRCNKENAKSQYRKEETRGDCGALPHDNPTNRQCSPRNRYKGKGRS